MATIAEIMTAAPVMPVITLEQVADAVPLALALAESGLLSLEIALRSGVALEVIREIKQALPQLTVGAGTVLTARDIDGALQAGADFLVSPGSTPVLIETALACNAALLPGAATVSEAMCLLDKGFTHLKLFPAEAIGGVALLRAISGPLPQLRFCPAGGIALHNASRYLELDNVLCVGGSWVAPAALIKAQDWAAIRCLAREAAQL